MDWDQVASCPGYTVDMESQYVTVDEQGNANPTWCSPSPLVPQEVKGLLPFTIWAWTTNPWLSPGPELLRRPHNVVPEFIPMV